MAGRHYHHHHCPECDGISKARSPIAKMGVRKAIHPLFYSSKVFMRYVISPSPTRSIPIGAFAPTVADSLACIASHSLAIGLLAFCRHGATSSQSYAQHRNGQSPTNSNEIGTSRPLSGIRLREIGRVDWWEESGGVPATRQPQYCTGFERPGGRSLASIDIHSTD